MRIWALAGAAALVAVAITGGAVFTFTAKRAPAVAQEATANTAMVVRGKLSAEVSMAGTLTYRARPDGSPYAVINQALGTYTKLPAEGAEVGYGKVLYRVDDHPVLLLRGSTPAYRSLTQGDSGPDCAELNANLVRLGHAPRAQLDPSSGFFSAETAAALQKLQARIGEAQTGSLDLGQAVFLPERVRVAKMVAQLGGPARPGAPVLQATSDALEVQLALDPSQQDEVRKGDPARVTLPGNKSVTGKVERLGRVAQLADGQNVGTGYATIPAHVSLDDPGRGRRLDQAPVLVEITTRGVEDVLSVPVTALVGKSGGGFAVEVVRAGGKRELVAVKLGLLDTAGGRVQVEGNIHEGDRVVVPSS